MKNDFNPFLITGYKSAQYFCDREDETALIKSHIKNNIHITLFAIEDMIKKTLATVTLAAALSFSSLSFAAKLEQNMGCDLIDFR